MSGEITRWLASSPSQRQVDASLTAIEGARDVTCAKVDAIADATGYAMGRVCQLTQLQQQLELLAPAAAGSFAYLVQSGTAQIASQVGRLH